MSEKSVLSLRSLRWSRFSWTALVLIVMLCLCVSTIAAPPAASWSGVLRDNSGTAIVGVTVILSDVSGKTAFTARTQAGGGFTFSAVAPATYKVAVVTQQGIYQATQSLVVTEGVALKTDLQLFTAEATLVLGQGQAAPASEGSGGEHLSRKEVSSLPLNSRDFSKLLLLAAGTMTDTNGTANFTQQFAVNGQRGVTGSSPWTARIQQIPKWAVPHFRLSMLMQFRKCNPIPESCLPKLVTEQLLSPTYGLSPEQKIFTAACSSSSVTQHSMRGITSITSKRVVAVFPRSIAMSLAER